MEVEMQCSDEGLCNTGNADELAMLRMNKLNVL